MNRYSVWEEAELVTGCINKWHNELQKKKHKDVREQIGREMGQLWSRLRARFFWNLVPEVRRWTLLVTHPVRQTSRLVCVCVCFYMWPTSQVPAAGPVSTAHLQPHLAHQYHSPP